MPREIQESIGAYIVRLAERLAATGEFATCHAVEVALRRRGFLEAFEMLQRAGQRRAIGALCAQARATGDGGVRERSDTRAPTPN